MKISMWVSYKQAFLADKGARVAALYEETYLYHGSSNERPSQHLPHAMREREPWRGMNPVHHAEEEDQVGREGEQLQRQAPDQDTFADILFAALPVARAGDAAPGTLSQERQDIRCDEDSAQPPWVETKDALLWARWEQQQDHVFQLPVESCADEDWGEDNVRAAGGVETNRGGVSDRGAARRVADCGEECANEQEDGVSVLVAYGAVPAASPDAQVAVIAQEDGVQDREDDGSS